MLASQTIISSSHEEHAESFSNKVIVSHQPFDRRLLLLPCGAHYGRRGGLCGARYRVFENPGMADKEVDLG